MWVCWIERGPEFIHTTRGGNVTINSRLLDTYSLGRYLTSIGLPNQININDLPDGATMRKIRYRTRQFYERFEKFAEEVNWIDFLLESKTIYHDRATNKWSF